MPPYMILLKWYATIRDGEVRVASAECEHRPHLHDYRIHDQEGLTNEQWAVFGVFAALDESLMGDTKLEALQLLGRRLKAVVDEKKKALEEAQEPLRLVITAILTESAGGAPCPT